MPENVRARAPLGRMLEWHQMKLVAGYLVAVVIAKPLPQTTIVLTLQPADLFATAIGASNGGFLRCSC